MEVTLEALEEAYQQLARGEAVCRPRMDIQIPTKDPNKVYVWGTMDGGSSVSGYCAIRMKSDIVYEQEYAGVRTREKYCVKPGLFCGLILLLAVENGEPLALLNDGYLQHMRVGGDAGIGVKYMAREDSRVIGMFGSGGMARTYAEAICLVRKIERIQVFSPTQAHREEYSREMSHKLGLEVVPVDHPEEVYAGADLIAGCTDSNLPLIQGKWLRPGMHIVYVGGGLDEAGLRRVDVSLKLGTAQAPAGHPELRLPDLSLAYVALPQSEPRRHQRSLQQSRERNHGVIAEDRVVYLEDLLAGRAQGRRSPRDITYSARGNIQGAQFFSVAGKVYELAKAQGLGREIPTEWFLQDIRD
ncbi:MAG: ornithine cyclodeaminase family protein [Chloroflexi bacterium]|nr:ornithine cyclodeaminase family protein [Chloroflexota bacterium]